MKLRWLLVILYITTVASTEISPKDYYDPNDEDDGVTLWKTLFTKLNTINLQMDEISKHLLVLNRRQEDQENKMTKLIEAADFNMKFLNDSRSESHGRFDDLSARLATQEYLKSKASNHGQTWTTILRRQDGSVDFFRNWSDYQKGFGNSPNGEFFIGLNKLHELTTDDPQELMVVLRDWKNEMRYAHYDQFQIGAEDDKYALKVLGSYRGNAGDYLRLHKGSKFSTFDQDNDEVNKNCAEKYEGAWWFTSNCYFSHLTGKYRKEHELQENGIEWRGWKQDYSLKFAEMKIRPKYL